MAVRLRCDDGVTGLSVSDVVHARGYRWSSQTRQNRVSDDSRRGKVVSR